MVTVMKDGPFPSVQRALDYLERNPGQERRIVVHPGCYRERVTVRLPGVEITGESGEAASETKVTYSLGGNDRMPDGEKRGTFRTHTFMVEAPNVLIKNLTIENAAGPGAKAGQAIALYADGDGLVLDSCRLLGWQDTLFTAPLPPMEIEKNGFLGPKQYAPRENRRQYYKNCYIEGEVDFIFGGAAAYFENCTFFSKNTKPEAKGYVTAPSTPKGLPYGYVMESCKFTSDCPRQSVFLGRPWRGWGSAVLLRCALGGHIKAEGWNDWGKEQAHETVFFAEYHCTGPGADLSGRPEWIHILTDKEAEAYTKEAVLGMGASDS